MTKKIAGTKSRKQHTGQFKAEAFALAETVSVAAAARDLGIQESQLYTWRRKQKDALSVSQTERDQSAEIARLKKELARKDEELAIVKKAAMDSIARCNTRCSNDTPRGFNDTVPVLFGRQRIVILTGMFGQSSEYRNRSGGP